MIKPSNIAARIAADIRRMKSNAQSGAKDAADTVQMARSCVIWPVPLATNVAYRMCMSTSAWRLKAITKKCIHPEKLVVTGTLTLMMSPNNSLTVETNCS